MKRKNRVAKVIFYRKGPNPHVRVISRGPQGHQFILARVPLLDLSLRDSGQARVLQEAIGQYTRGPRS